MVKGQMNRELITAHMHHTKEGFPAQINVPLSLMGDQFSLS